MKPSQFIIDRLNQLLSKKIGDINVRYGYDTISDYHVVEIFPESIRRGSEEYLDFEEALWSDFYKEFPNEDILICEMSESNKADEVLLDEIKISENIKLNEPSTSSSFVFRFTDSFVPLNGEAFMDIFKSEHLSSPINYAKAA